MTSSAMPRIPARASSSPCSSARKTLTSRAWYWKYLPAGPGEVRIRDPLMIMPDQRLEEGLPHLSHLELGERRLLELAVFELLVDDPVDHLFDRLGSGLFGLEDSPACRLQGIGQHHDGRLGGLWLVPDMPEIIWVDGIAPLAPCLLLEEADDFVAM